MFPTEAVARWRGWAVKGDASVIAHFFKLLDAGLPVGWKRNRELPLVEQSAAGYTFQPHSHAGEVSLSLVARGETEVRGGGVWSAAVFRNICWDEVMRLLDEGIVPAAQAAGAEIRIPTPGDFFLSELPSEAREQLLGFSRAARKSLPLNHDETDLWRGFVIAYFRGNALMDPAQFTDWLVRDGWPQEVAGELTVQFFDLCRFLSRFVNEAPAA